MKGKSAMFDRQTRKFCSAVVEALPEVPPEIMQGLITNPRALQKALRDALLPPAYRIWKTIQGFCDSVEECLDALPAAGCNNTRSAEYLFSRVNFAPNDSEVTLVRITPLDLGFTFKPTYRQFCECAAKSRLVMCEPNDGPDLRLNYLDQPEGENIFIAMNPVAAIDCFYRVFNLTHTRETGLTLTTSLCGLEMKIDPRGMWVFRSSMPQTGK